MQKHAELIISCIVSLLSLVLSELLPSTAAKLAFILLVFACIILFLAGQEKKRHAMQYASCFLGIGLILVLMMCAISPELPSQALEWVKGQRQDKTEEVPSPEELYWQNRSGREASLGALAENMTRASGAAGELSGMLQSQALLSTSSDPDEVQSVLAKMEEDKEVIERSFSALKTDRDDVMMYYKMRLYGRVWRYSSMISAFEAYGIDCQGLGVDEYTLLVWDAENLYNIYSMKKELEEDWGANTFFAEKKLYFNEHKMDDMNEYSDLFDYREWYFRYENMTAQELEGTFNDLIMAYYRRLMLNFSRPAD
ncbi:MAG: hypothetical protein HFF63_04495 [Oscillospiraceae bacterium]|nr:hypothetical protein [Oscillospiraceae bacterium]